MFLFPPHEHQSDLSFDSMSISATLDSKVASAYLYECHVTGDVEVPMEKPPGSPRASSTGYLSMTHR
jgi:hypothetical protein